MKHVYVFSIIDFYCFVLCRYRSHTSRLSFTQNSHVIMYNLTHDRCDRYGTVVMEWNETSGMVRNGMSDAGGTVRAVQTSKVLYGAIQNGTEWGGRSTAVWYGQYGTTSYGTMESGSSIVAQNCSTLGKK